VYMTVLLGNTLLRVRGVYRERVCEAKKREPHSSWRYDMLNHIQSHKTRGTATCRETLHIGYNRHSRARQTEGEPVVL